MKGLSPLKKKAASYNHKYYRKVGILQQEGKFLKTNLSCIILY